MDVLIADRVSEKAIKALRGAGYGVTYDPALKAESLLGALESTRPQILIVRSTKVPASYMDANLRLELVVRAGAGYDNIDVDAASRRGIFVANCPGKNAAAVAELAFGLIISLDRRIPDNVIEARAGRWRKANFSKAAGLKGRTLGLIGLGSIGLQMVVRAQAFGMPVIAWSRSLTDELAHTLELTRAENPLDVAAGADIVSLHVAAVPETHGMVDINFLEAMRPGAFLINTARSDLVDQSDLLQALDRQDLKVAIDVPANEPTSREADFEHPLAGHPDVYITHHIGASTRQAEDAIGAEVVRIIETFAATGDVLNCVNIATHTPATHMLTVRHRDKVGVLAAVLDEVRKAHWNIQEMENLVFAGAQAACARIRFDGTPSDEVVRKIATQQDVLAVSLIQLSH